jgi:glycosyltransferase involved in cell wall biosynthesis
MQEHGAQAAKPRVSVIVPTYREPHKVSVLLRSLREQSYPADLFEVFLVDNSPQGDEVSMFASDRVKVLHEPQPGSYAARNWGISQSSSEVIAFTDSDCIPHPEWISEAVNVLMAGADRVAGRIELFHWSLSPTVSDDLQKCFAFDVEHDLQERNQVATANFVVWRHSFMRVGLFNPEMLSGGDVEWGLRAKEVGLTTVFSPKAIVFHPSRSHIRDLLRHRKRISGGIAAMHTVSEKVIWAKRGLIRRRGVLRRIFSRGDLGGLRKLRVLSLATILHLYQMWETLLFFVFPGRSPIRS